MQKFIAITTASIIALTSFSTPALAKKFEHDYRTYYHGRDYDRYRYDNGHHYGWDHRGPSHSWRQVTVYSRPSYPVYGAADYSEIRCTNSYNPLGLLIGGAAGAALGTTIGKGSGRTAAIASGAVLGSILGNNMTQQRCSEQVFSSVPIGRPVSWQAGPREAYAVVPVQDYRTDGRYCREYQAVATVGGRRSETYGTACMQPDGSWEVVN